MLSSIHLLPVSKPGGKRSEVKLILLFNKEKTCTNWRRTAANETCCQRFLDISIASCSGLDRLYNFLVGNGAPGNRSTAFRSICVGARTGLYPYWKLALGHDGHLGQRLMSLGGDCELETTAGMVDWRYFWWQKLLQEVQYVVDQSIMGLWCFYQGTPNITGLLGVGMTNSSIVSVWLPQRPWGKWEQCSGLLRP